MFNLFKKTKPAGETATLKLSGLHCSSCSINIDGELEETTGVLSSHTSYAKQESVVNYDPAKISLSEIYKTIEKLGYKIVS